jgi:CBS domain-containing protein
MAVLEEATVGQVMHEGAVYIAGDASVTEAARLMRDADVGALPVRGEDGSLKAMVTDRDIVVRCLAQGRDPYECTVSEIVGDGVLFVEATDPVGLALRIMAASQVRRLPVFDGGRLVGVVSQADVARSAPHDATGALVEAISRRNGTHANPEPAGELDEDET